MREISSKSASSIESEASRIAPESLSVESESPGKELSLSAVESKAAADEPEAAGMKSMASEVVLRRHLRQPLKLRSSRIR